MTIARKTVGVLGGMGPDATVDFIARVVAMTPAECDQDHIHMIVDNDPGIPPRQDAILHGGASPGPAIAAMAKRLQDAGADFLVMPCNTAHAFSTDIAEAVDIPLLSIIAATVAASVPFARVGLMATEGCLRSGCYQTAFRETGTRLLEPGDAELSVFMDLIFRIKRGDAGKQVTAGMRSIAGALQARGVQAIIAGCTELPLVLDGSMLDVPLISSTDELARQTIACACGEVSPEDFRPAKS